MSRFSKRFDAWIEAHERRKPAWKLAREKRLAEGRGTPSERLCMGRVKLEGIVTYHPIGKLPGTCEWCLEAGFEVALPPGSGC